MGGQKEPLGSIALQEHFGPLQFSLGEHLQRHRSMYFPLSQSHLPVSKQLCLGDNLDLVGLLH